MRMNYNLSGDEDDLDVDGGEGFEVYTWAGQTRVRATSGIEGGLRGASGFVSITRGDETQGFKNLHLVEKLLDIRRICFCLPVDIVPRRVFEW